MATQAKWELSGDYFENCNCNVVCPCLVSAGAPLTARPTQGVCDVVLAFHIDKGKYADVSLDGLNVVVAAHTPGPMGEGNWTLAAYIDERANDQQTEALGTIFGGAAGGPMAIFAPLVSNNLGAKKVAINYAVKGKNHTVNIPGICIWLWNRWEAYIHLAKFGPQPAIQLRRTNLRLLLASKGSTFTDHGMRWDNSGKNGHYAPIRWSN